MADKPDGLSSPSSRVDRGNLNAVIEIMRTPGICGLDTETTIARAHARELCVVQVAHVDGREAWAQVYGDARALRRLSIAVTAAQCTFVAHNATFEWEQCLKIGAMPPDLRCTYVAARVLHGAMIGTDDEHDEEFGGWSLKDLVAALFGVQLDKSEQTRDWTQPLDASAVEYALSDARWARDLWILFEDEFDKDPDQLRGFNVVNDALPAIATCNIHGGLVFDRKAHADLCVQLEADLAAAELVMDLACEEKIEKHGSGKQVSRWVADEIFKAWNTEPRRSPHIAAVLFAQDTFQHWRTTADGGLSFDKNVVSQVIEHVEVLMPDVGAYLRARVAYQKAKKVLDAFGPKLVEKVDVDGCLRGSLKAHGARTSRMSCIDPNLQQMPTDDPKRGFFFRRLFKALVGRKLVISDYGQIELRVGCIIADDKRMQLVFAQGYDIHAATAVAVFALGAYDDDNPVHVMLRKKAKAPNFAALYGAEAPTIAINAGIPVQEATELLGAWLNEYQGVARYRVWMPEKGRADGYIQIASGQKIKVVRNTRGPQMINAPVQGGSASVMYRAATRVWRRLREEGLDAELAMIVHDEILVDSAEECAVQVAYILQEEMLAALLEFFPQAAELGVDKIADASICDSWADKDNKACKLDAYIERMAA